MVWVIVWFIICILYITVSIFQFRDVGFSNTELIITLTGFIGLLSTLVMLLYQNNLTCYFYWFRLKNWLRNYPSKWRLDVRYDGSISKNIVNDIHEFLSQLKKENVPVKIYNNNVNTIDFTIYETLHFYLSYQPQEFNDYGYDTIDIFLAPFEIGANDSKNRLNKKILPILSRLQAIVKPDNSSYVLNINFTKGNPFFALFISHLKSSQISDFTINLHLSEYSEATIKDIVTIKKENIIISAHDIHSLKQLAYDFIYLSTTAKQYIRASNNG